MMFNEETDLNVPSLVQSSRLVCSPFLSHTRFVHTHVTHERKRNSTKCDDDENKSF